jgi:SAM-dependent methyltransferase
VAELACAAERHPVPCGTVSFRDELYASYTLHSGHASSEASADFDRVRTHYFRGWLPSDPDAPVLDLGCGSGQLLGFLTRSGLRSVVGVDRSPPQVERSRRAAPGAELVLGDGRALLRERAGSFGAIFCIDVLEHLTRDELLEYLHLIVAALRPGGVLIAQVPNADSPFHGAIRYGDLTHELAFTVDALAHLFAIVGLERAQFRECGPVAKNAKGIVRVGLWKLMRGALRAWNAIETGSAGRGVYTRVMLARAERSPRHEQVARGAIPRADG